MKVSIAMSYHNRKNQLLNTIDSIIKTTHKNYEIVIVDDASDEDHNIDFLPEKYPFIKLISLKT
jgi:glycosyltransferase involved in cell wall biosynthesis